MTTDQQSDTVKYATSTSYSDKAAVIDGDETAPSPPSEQDSPAGKDFDDEEQQQRQNPGGPPDGGLFAWIQVLACFFLYLNTWGIIAMFGVFQTYYQTVLLTNRSPDDISWIGSLQIFLLFLGGCITGPLFDAGFLRALILVGSLLACLGMFMTSLCTAYWEFMLAQGVCMGLGFGCLFLPTIGVISQYFSSKKAIAFGIASLGGSTGGIIFPIIFRRLEQHTTFGWATRAIAFIMLGTLVVPVLFMRPRAHAAKGADQGIATKPKLQFVDFNAYKKPALSLYVLGIYFGFSSIYVAQYYIQLYATQETSINRGLSFYLLPIVNAATIPGRLISNYYADKLGPLNVQVPNAVAAAILCFCWIAIHSSGGIIVFAVLYGFFIGSFNSLPGVTVVGLSPDLSKVGLQLGVSFLAAAIGTLTGEPIAGAILRSPGGWPGLQAWCAVLLLMFGVFTAAARLLETGPKLLAKA